MTPGRRVVAVLVGSVQLVLAAAAWADLAQQPAKNVNGPKKLWAVLIAVNWVGPIAYFVKGRRSTS